jgi:hypothetical protein
MPGSSYLILPGENIIINFLALNILKMNMEDDKASYC